MRLTTVIPFLMVFVDLSMAQLNLPDMPGPPYPDKYGNNRWGVKYDPRVHGRGRQHGSPSTSGAWEGDAPQYSPSVRHRPAHQSTRSKWTAALKPLVSRYRISKSKNMRNRRPSGSPFDPTSDSFYESPYTSKAIDGYVKNYMNTYNKVSQIPTLPSAGLASIKSFANPTSISAKFRARNFGLSDNRRSFDKSASSSSINNSGSSTSSLTASYSRAAAGLSDTETKPLYRTVDPQNDFFGPRPKLEKKKSDFAKTLSNIYSDYKPGDENTVGSSSLGSSSSSANVAANTDSLSNSFVKSYDEYASPYSYQSPSPLSSPESPSSYYIKGPQKHSNSYSSAAEALSSLDLLGDGPTYSTSHLGNGPVEVEYSKFPGVKSGSGDDGFSNKYPTGSITTSSSGPVTVSSYTVSGSSPFSASPYSSSAFDSFGHSGRVSSSVSHFPTSSVNDKRSPQHGSAPSPHVSSDAPIPVLTPIAPISLTPVSIAPVNYLPSSNLYYPSSLYQLSTSSASNTKSKKSKRKKKPFQHTPINVLRGLLGRTERRDRNRESEDNDYKSAYAVNYPLALPPPVSPPQYAYSPYLNTLASAPVSLDYGGPMYAGGLPPPPPLPHYSPLSVGISNLRDSLTTGYRAAPPPPPRFSSQSVGANDELKKEGGRPLGPVTQHVQDWPRIFTAMGSSVDAVAGGIHAVRKEISKMTGKTFAKGILMGGSAVHEVSKGMASVIQKMSSI